MNRLGAVAVLFLVAGCQRGPPVGGPCTYARAEVPCRMSFGPHAQALPDGGVEVTAEFEGVPILQRKTWVLPKEEADALVAHLRSHPEATCVGSKITSGACTPWMSGEVRLAPMPKPVP